MFFYRDTVIQAKTKEELYNHSECPICHNKLAPDWKMPLRYEPMALFRIAIIGSTFATLLCVLFVKLREIGWLDFLKQFSYSDQSKIIIAILAFICIPVAFVSVWGEIKLGHIAQDDKIAYGMKCPTCGNGFVGLVAREHVNRTIHSNLEGQQLNIESEFYNTDPLGKIATEVSLTAARKNDLKSVSEEK